VRGQLPSLIPHDASPWERAAAPTVQCLCPMPGMDTVIETGSCYSLAMLLPDTHSADKLKRGPGCH
jgi:hypothetical protein